MGAVTADAKDILTKQGCATCVLVRAFMLCLPMDGRKAERARLAVDRPAVFSSFCIGAEMTQTVNRLEILGPHRNP